jgi:hypothetical protein
MHFVDKTEIGAKEYKYNHNTVKYTQYNTHA